MADFKATSLQVGNLKRAINESSKGDLVFRDAKWKAGLTLTQLYNGLAAQNNAQIIENTNNIAGLIGITGNLDARITANELAIANLDLDYATDEDLANVSAFLQAQITSNDTDILGLVGISGNHETRITSNENALATLDATYVNTLGDTMVGDLAISGSDFSIFNLSGISGNFLTTNESGKVVDSGLGIDEINSLISITGQQQLEIDANTLAIANLDYATDADLVLVSSNLQAQISSNDVDILNLQTATNTISGDLDILEQQVADLDLTYATDSDLQLVSSNLQAQIISNDVDILNLQTITTTISGDLDTLEQQVADLDLTYATDADLQLVSSNLQAQIISNDVDILGLVGISGNHEQRILDLEDISDLDAKYVDVTGDTMTGTLTISGADLNVPDLITTEENVAQIDALGNLITSELQELYVPVEDITDSNADGVKGQWSYGLGYFYSCIATNTWVKHAIIIDTTSNVTNLIEALIDTDLTISSLSGISGNFLTTDSNGKVIDSGISSTTTGDLQDQLDGLIAISGNHETRITNNEINISTLQTITTTISGDLDTLEQQVADLDLTNATDADLQLVSSNLQAQITDNDADILTLQTQTSGISGGINQLDDRFVNKSGDIMVGDLTINANANVNGTLTINGDIIQISGSNITEIAQTLTVEDNLILLNKGEVGAGVLKGEAGIEIDRGTLENYKFIFRESDQAFVVGVTGELQAVATREDAPIDTALAIWNDTEKRFDTNSLYTIDTLTTDSELNAVSGNLQAQITDNDADILALQTITTTISGDLDTLEQTVADFDLDANYVNVDGDTMTGTLVISGADLTISNLSPISGNFLTTDEDGTVIDSGYNKTVFDEEYVNVNGDTMTGDLTVNADVAISGNLTVETDVTISGGTYLPSLITVDENRLAVNDDGKVISVPLDEQFVPFEDGLETGVKGQWSYGDDNYWFCVADDTWIPIYDKNILDAIIDGFVTDDDLEERFVPLGNITDENSTGEKGQWSFGGGYKYECIARNTWIRFVVANNFTV